jgi:1-deoxy-D-xylulose-5-phosphate synthase
MEKLIDSLNLPIDLRTLTVKELETVAAELREELVATISTIGGHFASSLGTTELSVALHHLFQTPDDRIVWDVGHQAYVHKMLTGRRDQLGTIRKRGGISGFLKRCESEYDSFGAGHAGTSISAAVGMAVGLKAQGKKEQVVAVIGDGSMTAGMAFEALNHAGHLGLDNLIVVLNDNEMSISPNVGAISWLFSKAVTSSASNVIRARFKNLYRKGYVPEVVYKMIDKAEEMTQGFFSGAAVLFEAFGFRYIGPVDGHNIQDLLTALSQAREQDVPVLVHVYTTKGKGFEAAEEDPIKWHGVTPFCRTRSEFLSVKNTNPEPPSYTAVFADTAIDLMKRNEKIVAITAAMPGGTGLDKVMQAHPERCFDVGISEQHAVTFAGGLACEGLRPIAAIYSTFLQRGYDQVVHDVCIQKLPVLFAMDRGGVVGNDGETHQGVFDISIQRTLPNIVLMSPKDENELRHMMYTALHLDLPTALRYPRGNGTGVALDPEYKMLEIGKGEVLCRGKEVLMVCYGPLVQYGLRVAERLLREHQISTTVINARFAKPLDLELLRTEIPLHSTVCAIEDHALAGGFSSAILEAINDHKIALQHELLRFGVQDEYVTHASQLEQHQMNGYDPESMFNAILRARTARREHKPVMAVA